MGQVIDFKQAREEHYGKPAKISISLKRLARDNRREIIASFPYVRFWTSDITKEQYAYFLYLHWVVRKELEAELKNVGENFNVVNLFNNQQKSFLVDRYELPISHHTDLIAQDLHKLGVTPQKVYKIDVKVTELIAYIHRTAKVYSLALLGVWYMLEDNLCNFGPQLANSLTEQQKYSTLKDNGHIPESAFSYLNTYKNRRPRLWQFRQSLDDIVDFQSQANVIIAATITYQIYRDLLDPRALRKGARQLLVDTKNSDN